MEDTRKVSVITPMSPALILSFTLQWLGEVDDWYPHPVQDYQETVGCLYSLFRLLIMFMHFKMK